MKKGFEGILDACTMLIQFIFCMIENGLPFIIGEIVIPPILQLSRETKDNYGGRIFFEYPLTMKAAAATPISSMVNSTLYSDLPLMFQP